MGCQRKEGRMKATAEKDRGFQEILTAVFVGHRHMDLDVRAVTVL